MAFIKILPRSANLKNFPLVLSLMLIIPFTLLPIISSSHFPIISEAWAATYYVDATNGNDSNNGTSESTPWKTIAKVNASKFNPEVRMLKNKPSPFLDCKMHSMNQHFQSSILESPLVFAKSSQLW